MRRDQTPNPEEGTHAMSESQKLTEGQIETAKVAFELKRAIRKAGSPEEKRGLFDAVKLLRSAHEVKEVQAAWQKLKATTAEEVEADPDGEEVTEA
jgi:hypothetical protein